MQFRMVMKKGGFEIEPGVFVPQGELLCFSPAESHHDEEVIYYYYLLTNKYSISKILLFTNQKDGYCRTTGLLDHGIPLLLLL